jgi:hypothetical protein
MALPTAPIAAGSLIGGYLVARETGVRPLGGVVLALGAAWCARAWLRDTDRGTTGALLALYIVAFAASHPLAKKIGAWPSVLTVAAVAGAVAWTAADRRPTARVPRPR